MAGGGSRGLTKRDVGKRDVSDGTADGIAKPFAKAGVGLVPDISCFDSAEFRYAEAKP